MTTDQYLQSVDKRYQSGISREHSRIGASKNIKVVRMHTKTLSERALIGSIKYGTAQRMGKREYFHYLTKKGSNLLINELFYMPEHIKKPKAKKPNITTDYHHRKSTIDFQIALYQHLEVRQGEALFFDTYYERTGSNRTGVSKSKTVIDTKQSYLLADALFMIDVPQGDTRKSYLYAFEMQNTNSTKNITEQLYRYLEYLEIGSITLKYDFDKAARILSVFEDVNKMHNTLNRIKAHPSFDNVRKFYLFKPLQEIWSDGIYGKWITADGEVVGMW